MVNYGTLDTFFESLVNFANLDVLKGKSKKVRAPKFSQLEQDVEIEEKYLEHLFHNKKDMTHIISK